MTENKASQSFLPHPELPVLFISAAGDQEGKSSMTLGFFNGEIEDVLREVAPEANRKEPSYKADYEVDIFYYPAGQTQEVLKHIQVWERRIDTEVKYVPHSPTRTTNMSVLVHIWQENNKEVVGKFLKALKPDTKYRREEGFFSPEDEFIVIQL